ncbi:hypothetical protein OGZ02_01450 [Brachyspira hyodysenteriae]|nr:hypothetical protein [Brachyspira hyodysenteriae]MDA0033745.1 hypothetical protein [Brachyspira hyodysenteriae]MDA1467532.1 hypothetical protein [Brachyspira hyodysenteriae]
MKNDNIDKGNIYKPIYYGNWEEKYYMIWLYGKMDWHLKILILQILENLL